MTDDRKKPRSTDLPIEDADVKFLAENTDLSPNQALALIGKHGRDRGRLLELATTMKAEG